MGAKKQLHDSHPENCHFEVRWQENGQYRSQIFHLGNGQSIFLGRMESAFDIKAEGVSRKHCELINVDGYLYVKDLKSTNGTFLNSKRVKTGELIAENGEVGLGKNFKLLISFEGASEDSAVSEVTELKEVKKPAKEKFKFKNKFKGKLKLKERFAKVIKRPAKKNAQVDSPDQNDLISDLVHDRESSSEVQDHIEHMSQFTFPPLESMGKNLEHWKSLYLTMIKTPKVFFENMDFNGSLKTSLIYIGVCTMLSVFLSTFSTALTLVMFVPMAIATIISYLIFAGIFHILKATINLKGEFNEYVRVMAYGSLLSLPAALINFIPIVGFFAPLAVYGWMLFGFYRAFYKNKDLPE